MRRAVQTTALQISDRIDEGQSGDSGIKEKNGGRDWD